MPKTKIEIIQGDGKPDLTLEPFFRGREEARLIHLLQSPIYRRALALYFDRHGCLHCGRKDRPHKGHLLCDKCYGIVRRELKEYEREIEERMHP